MPSDPPTRREFLETCGLVLAAPWVTAAETASHATGSVPRGLEPFDELMTSFLQEHDVPGAALAVTRHSQLVYARGFGWADRDERRPVQPDSLFRIASISKPVTAVAVMQLVEQGRVGLDDRFLDAVPLEPFIEQGREIDPRVRTITIRQLLQHTAGWDRDISFDPIARPWEIAERMGKTAPPSPTDVARYSLGLPLDFAPGSRYAYANVDYLCLGRLIEHFDGQPYVDAVLRRVLGPLKIQRMQLGRALESQLAPAEVRYYDRRQRCGRCLYPPLQGEQVPLVYGAENLEGYEAHGGWIASAIDLVRLATAFDRPDQSSLLQQKTIEAMWERPEGAAGRQPDGSPAPTYYACGWSVRPVPGRGLNAWHTGRIAGTSTLLVRRWDGLCWAVLFNTDTPPAPSEEPLARLIDPLVHRAADAVAHWPDIDLFSEWLSPAPT